MKLTKRETATVLAALRNLSQDMTQYNETEWDAKAAFSDIFADHEPLNEDEIDALCERINCDEEDS